MEKWEKKWVSCVVRQEGSRAGYGVKGNMFVLGIKECGFESCYPEEKVGKEKREEVKQNGYSKKIKR